MGDLLKDKVAVITGAGNGLGRAYAFEFAKQGAKVVVNDLGTSPDGEGSTNSAADDVVNEIKKSGGTAVASYASVTEEDQAESIIQQTVDTFGRLDIMINNAGVIRNNVIWDIQTKDFDLVVRTHIYGTFFCTRAACRIMKEQGYGRIVNTSSHNGLGFWGQVPYSTVKEAIVGLSRTVARDMAQFNVTCNVIRPVAAWRGAVDKNPNIERHRPEDIAALVTYLVTEQAGNLNGCIFEVFRGHVGMYKEPQPVEQTIWKDGQWTPEELVKAMPETLSRGQKANEFPNTLPYMFDAILNPDGD